MTDTDTSLAADLASAMGDTSTASAEATATATVETPAPPEAATTAPAETTTATVTTEPIKQGPIPFDVHHKALENARVKAVEEKQAEWEREYGWAKNPQLRAIVDRVVASHGDPLAFFAQQFDELANHPQFSQSFRSFLGQRLGALRQRQPQEVTAPEPDVAIYNDQGQVVGHTYSAEAQAKRETFLKAQWLQEVQQSLAPKFQTLDTLEKEREQQQARQQHAERQQQAQAFGASMFDELKSLPGFDLEQHGKAIAEEMERIPLADDAHPDVVKANAYRAYTKVVVPTLDSQARKAIVTTQQQKAIVNTASPQTGSTGTPKSYADMTWAEAFQHELAAKR